MNGSKMLGELINDLRKIYMEHGDMPVASATNFESISSTAIYLDIMPYYYDGGCIYPELKVDNDSHCTHWKRSKNNPNEFGEKFLVIASDCPDLGDGGDVVNGIRLPEIKDWKDDEDLEKQLDKLREAFEKAFNKC